MELNYKEFGQGEPIIILHGLFGTLDNWQTIAKQLAKEYWVFIIDQRNHGRSPHVEDLDYELMAEDLKDFMEQHWIPKAHIIGHSMGGKTAMQFAFDYPDMLDKLVVVDIGPGANKAGHDQIFEALLSLNLDQVANRTEADAHLQKNIEEYGVRQFLLKNLSRNKTGGYRWKMNLSAIHKNYQNILAEVGSNNTYDGESLFIKGAESNYISDAEKTTIRQSFTSVSIETIDKAGHWVHADKPAELLQKITSFLD